MTEAEQIAAMEAQIAGNVAIIAGYQTALATDSVDPVESMSLDGESSTTNEWRAGLLKAIADLQQVNIQIRKDINLLRPYFVPTRQVPW